MKEAGLDVGIQGMQEGCIGDAARPVGNEYLFQMLAETNWKLQGMQLAV
tara:strand:+ start:249 stop:395 length:147 start_codon:yes stop_codon:yes gene_type:complete